MVVGPRNQTSSTIYGQLGTSSDCPKLSIKGLAQISPCLLSDNLFFGKTLQKALNDRPIGFSLGLHGSISVLYIARQAQLPEVLAAACQAENSGSQRHRLEPLDRSLGALGLARANGLQARTSQGADADAASVRALAACKDFLTLWKGADLDIPILKQAKAEYAKLQ
jgi:hypothetical protein